MPPSTKQFDLVPADVASLATLQTRLLAAEQKSRQEIIGIQLTTGPTLKIHAALFVINPDSKKLPLLEIIAQPAGIADDAFIAKETAGKTYVDLAEVALGDGTTSVLLRRPGTPPAAHSALGLTFLATKAKVSDKKPTPDSFLQQLVEWGKNAPEGIFADNATSNDDVYPNFVKELGPYGDIVHRRACMLEVMRVLAGFESSWNWGEGIDQSKPEKLKKNSSATEAGAWQVSLDAVGNGNDLKTLLVGRGLDLTDAGAFQNAMKTDHPLAMEFIARLLRHTCHHNGPLFSHLVNGQLNETVHKWLNRDAVKEFQRLLTT